jgi:hypothetical protein
MVTMMAALFDIDGGDTNYAIDDCGGWWSMIVMMTATTTMAAANTHKEEYE